MRQYLIIALVFASSVCFASGCHRRCVKTCKGVPNGKYQSCKGCSSFVVCGHGNMRTGYCRHGYYWDDFLKSCQIKSSTCPKPDSNPCITNCTGIPNGVFQSCKDCHLYAVCYHGITHIKTCSHGTFWDDSLKRCQKTSDTCPTTVPNRGISSCAGLPEGDYQSCLNCHVYVTCASGVIHDNRTCPANLVWDDFHKRCESDSPTCPPGGSNPCMRNCTGQPDGNYQSCNGCDVYATCCHSHLMNDRKCPSGTVWDDSLKGCEKTSKTCRQNTTEILDVTSHDDMCVTNCSDKSDGIYQSCIDCGVYVLCSNNVISIMPCPGTTLWDDSFKRCQEKSTTCPRLMNHLLNP